MDSNLWTFVRSETVTVKADGSSVVNVYYDRTQKTLTFKYNYRNYSYNTTKTITAKWGEDIADEYVAIADDAGSTFWSATSDGEGPYTNYFGVMPIASATYYHRDASGSSGTMRYYGEDLNGVYQEMFSVNDVGGYTVTVEDRYEFEGFTYHHGTSTGSSCSGAAFYYTRNSYNLIFNDGYNDVRTESVKFEAPLSTYEDYVPIVPSAYEPGSVEFGGWYLNPECTGEEYKLAEHTMPADNVLLYAKWVPVTHTVEFYLDRAAYDAGTKLSTHPDVTVSHGSMVTPEPADPTNGDYTFVEWFYLDENGEEKAIDFANMTVNQDLKVYAKWSSNVLVEYSVYFKTKDENGEEIEIADPITGSSLAGNSKTFDAKGEGELYADYQSGYFPLVKSHTLTLSIDDPTKNTFTFWYEPAIEVPYIVKYLDAETGDSLYDDKVVSDNAKAVVTETFVTISGYMPDAYQKRLVVTGDKNIADNTWIEVTMDDGETVKVHPENVIIFEYTEDEEHSYYKITHYTQNTDGENWTEYKSSEAVGDIGIYYTGSPLTIPGFTYNRIEYKVEGKVVSEDKITDEGVALTPDGLEINLYYNRNEYPYQVRYLEQGTGRELHTPKDGTGLYGQVISETAIDNIENYTAVDPTSQTLNIHIEESNEAKLNIITFYYVENDVTINYVAVGPTGAADFGSVSPTSETIKVLTGEAKGSTATATSNVYRFVGWYKDEACTNQISTDAKYVPAKVDDKNVAATYYAKFEYNLTSLTIQKTGVDEEFDPGASFVFNIFGEGVDLDVVIYGNGTTEIYGLTVGETYTVTETAGSWRYTPDATSKTIKLNAAGNKVTFVNERTGTQWLDSNCSEENVFTAPTGTTN